MLAAVLAAALQALPPPPPIVDYFPGPFFWPVEGRADALAGDFDVAVLRDAAELGTLAFSVCVERAQGGRVDRRDRRLLARVRQRLESAGVDAIRLDPHRCTPPQLPRGSDGVMIHPVPRS